MTRNNLLNASLMYLVLILFTPSLLFSRSRRREKYEENWSFVKQKFDENSTIKLRWPALSSIAWLFTAVPLVAFFIATILGSNIHEKSERYFSLGIVSFILIPFFILGIYLQSRTWFSPHIAYIKWKNTGQEPPLTKWMNFYIADYIGGYLAGIVLTILWVTYTLSS